MNLQLHYVISLITTGLILFTLAIFVYCRNKNNVINRTYTTYTLSAFLWSFSEGLLIIAPNKSVAIFWNRLCNVGIFFIATTFLHFIFSILNIDSKKRRKFLLCAYFYSFITIPLLFTKIFLPDPVPKYSLNYFIEPGPIYPFFVFIWFGIVSYGLILISKACASSQGMRRNQLKYLFWGTLIGYIGGSGNYFLTFDMEVYPLNPFGTYGVVIYAIMVTYAIVAYHLMDINVIITRSLAYGTLTAIIAGTYIGLMVAIDRFFGGVTGYNPILAHSLLFIGALFALIYVLPRMKIRAIELARRAVFGGKYDYQQELDEAAKKIPTMLDLEQLGDYILAKIRDTMMIDKLSLLVYDEAEHTYLVLASFGLDKDMLSKVKIDENSGLADFLERTSEFILKDDLERMGKISVENRDLMKKQFDSLDAELCIPLMVKDDLAGILALSNKRTKDMFTDEDLQSLVTLANQVALTTEYIKAVDKISSEKRYVGLGKAAMRMAHDIKNPLVPLKTFLQILPVKYPREFASMAKLDAEFTGRFYGSALEGIDRINRLIERALHYVGHPQPHFSQVRLDTVLDEVVTQENVSLKKAKIQLRKQYKSLDGNIEADREQLMELFSNLIGNSIDAMEESQSKKLTIKAQKSRSDQVAVEIADTGCGIPKDKINTVFDPFITYKHKGSGLGLAIVKKIVDDHHGIVEVKSTPGKGTSFKITLLKRQ